ncbi:SDR family NAD(P)-dependent oxidoreductase (plasmid) [Nocardioides sp. R1-1]|uniref:SDR family NAD(P)-dependent oxidoreductase n=1 Tax=Nocardioides sp. R1-1 TaxID=3383502 RepID=UPI0038CF3950
MGNLEGRVAIVFGAGAGTDGVTNGQAAALLYARAGAQVVAVDLDPDCAARTASAITTEGGVALPITADATDGAAVLSAVEAALERFGTIDVLHNNVGVTVLGGPVELSYEDWRRAFEINVDTVFLTTKHVLPTMFERGRGAIVNVSSIASLRDVGYPYPAYMASKAAVNQVTVSLAVQYGDRGIRANAVAPGFMDTPMVRRQLHSQAASVDKLLETRCAASPTGQMGTCWDVANASLFLASDEAQYVNGVCLPVDGGLTMRCV